MNRNQKFFNKLNDKERAKVIDASRAIYDNKLDGFDLIKLKGSSNFFRIKIGRIRIVFSTQENGENKIEYTGFRNEKTYRDF